MGKFPKSLCKILCHCIYIYPMLSVSVGNGQNENHIIATLLNR